MLRILLVVCLFVVGALMMDTSSAEAGRWRRCRRAYRQAYYSEAYYRPARVYRPYYYGPRVRVGVGYYGYGW